MNICYMYMNNDLSGFLLRMNEQHELTHPSCNSLHFQRHRQRCSKPTDHIEGALHQKYLRTGRVRTEP